MLYVSFMVTTKQNLIANAQRNKRKEYLNITLKKVIRPQEKREREEERNREKKYKKSQGSLGGSVG